ncbi:hypothetical protein EMIHUDRAFT_221950 [Emiliania huxleyi CCMP1516]|uniref:Polycomb protein VEFS-Box domain-containing protein n=2 Tax=Emiliania huxleyi TaxID=2903 RepID=A0A0D3HXP4_EMIH1|nr:hypothetical protein EMIHUDRAFT_221950 [Emiliania huxleyi CCMP1516]EOD03779.1 hypothetical protein EMIHUDRAFT_221950 [Emiliania huxleyi CCMP1516]|eukprot:XP_005756208.1 hypothetical protein EMIHUDRAFT_221950 [Emiliania huxleyi CCMP1516]
MPNPLLFVGKGAALTAAARAADKANEGGGAFQRLGEGRGAAIRLAWPAEALHTVPHERRAAAGDADDPFAHGRPITKRARRAAGELRAVQHQERAEAPREAERAAAEERTAEQAALLAPLAATDTTASLAKRRRSALVAAVLHQPIAEPAGRAAQMLAPLGEHLKRQCDEVAKRWDDFQTEMERLDEDGGDADMRSTFLAYWEKREREARFLGPLGALPLSAVGEAGESGERPAPGGSGFLCPGENSLVPG